MRQIFYYNVKRVLLQSATEHPLWLISVSHNGCHFLPRLPFFWQYPHTKKTYNWKYFDQKYTTNFTVHRSSAWHHCAGLTFMIDSAQHRGLYMRIFYKGNIFFFSFVFIAKIGDGFVCRIPNSGVSCTCNKPIWQRSFKKPSQAIC